MNNKKEPSKTPPPKQQPQPLRKEERLVRPSTDPSPKPPQPRPQEKK